MGYVSLLGVVLFPAHFSDILGLPTTQCYHIQDEVGPWFVQLGHVAIVNRLKDIRMRPSIEFAFLDVEAVWCLKESSLSIHTPKSFSHVVSSSFTVCPVWLVIV